MARLFVTLKDTKNNTVISEEFQKPCNFDTEQCINGMRKGNTLLSKINMKMYWRLVY